MNPELVCVKKLALDIKGQILNVINKLYSNAKCYVKMNGKLSNVFKSEIGVRQGDNLSLLLFLFYLSDLESSRRSKYSGLIKGTGPGQNHQKIVDFILAS